MQGSLALTDSPTNFESSDLFEQIDLYDGTLCFSLLALWMKISTPLFRSCCFQRVI